jgi:hypothetical protein
VRGEWFAARVADLVLLARSRQPCQPGNRPVEGLPGSAAGCRAGPVADGKWLTTSVTDDGTVLEGAQRARPDLPFACKERHLRHLPSPAGVR